MKEKRLPEKGIPKDDLFDTLNAMREGDIRWKSGKMFSLIYNAGEDIMSVGMDAFRSFMVENGLSPFAFPSLKKLETEVAAMVGSLFNGSPEAVGSMTSGGTESIFMAVKSARDKALADKPSITQPEIVIPLTAHPAFDKAAHYLNLGINHVPVDEGFRADPAAMSAAVTGNTILMAGSAMTYPHGIVDPIPELASIAAERKIWFHVDSCLGGFILPFAKKLGRPIPDFDFSVPGVTSISADLHKYAYAPKGASIVMYRNAKFREYQYFAYADWPGGVYGTSAFSGARNGGAIAGAWAIMHYLGEEGYLKLASSALEAAKILIEGVNAVPGLKVLGAPHATVFGIGGEGINVYALSDELGKRGWLLEKQHLPPSLHLTVSPYHKEVAGDFLKDLAGAADEVRGIDASKISQEAAMYGMMATMPDRKLARELAVQYLNKLYQLD